jgi:hypothetical protein
MQGASRGAINVEVVITLYTMCTIEWPQHCTEIPVAEIIPIPVRVMVEKRPWTRGEN